MMAYILVGKENTSGSAVCVHMCTMAFSEYSLEPSQMGQALCQVEGTEAKKANKKGVVMGKRGR